MNLPFPTMTRILRDATLGVAANPNASPEEQAFRAECDRDVAAAHAAGLAVQIPFDFENDPQPAATSPPAVGQ